MENEILEIIYKKTLEENTVFTKREEEIIEKILEDLKGIFVVRADMILDFCKRAILYSETRV